MVGVDCGLVVWATVVCGGKDEVVGAAVVAAGDGVALGGVVTAGAGAMTTGGGRVAVAGAGRGRGTLVTEDGVSTSVGASRDSDADRNAMTPTIPPTATVRMARPSPAVCSRRRRRAATLVSRVSSIATLRTSGSSSVTASSTSVSCRTFAGRTASPTSASGNTSGGATASTTSAAGAVGTEAAGGGGTAGSVGAAPLVWGTVRNAAAPAFGEYGPRPSFESSALAKSRQWGNRSVGFFLSARSTGVSK